MRVLSASVVSLPIVSLIRAQVGDTIRVVFRNSARFPASLHPHGVSYKKDSEGAHYNDGTSATDKADEGGQDDRRTQQLGLLEVSLTGG